MERVFDDLPEQVNAIQALREGLSILSYPDIYVKAVGLSPQSLGFQENEEMSLEILDRVLRIIQKRNIAPGAISSLLVYNKDSHILRARLLDLWNSEVANYWMDILMLLLYDDAIIHPFLHVSDEREKFHSIVTKVFTYAIYYFKDFNDEQRKSPIGIRSFVRFRSLQQLERIYTMSSLSTKGDY